MKERRKREGWGEGGREGGEGKTARGGGQNEILWPIQPLGLSADENVWAQLVEVEGNGIVSPSECQIDSRAWCTVMEQGSDTWEGVGE